jgi:glycosyltransferase involved in cell wall biosynthesis
MICDNYARKDDRFRVVHQKNQGVSKARNVGIELAQGEYLVFIDPDDYINDEYLASLYIKQKRTKADVVIAETLPFLDDFRFKFKSEALTLIAGKIAGRIMYNLKIPPLNSKKQIAENITRLSGSCWGKLFKTKLWNNIRFPEGISWGEDTFTVYESLCNAESIHFTADAVYFYRMMRNGSLSRKKMPPDKRDIIINSWTECCNRMYKANPYIQEPISRLLKFGMFDIQAHTMKHNDKELNTL